MSVVACNTLYQFYRGCPFCAKCVSLKYLNIFFVITGHGACQLSVAKKTYGKIGSSIHSFLQCHLQENSINLKGTSHHDQKTILKQKRLIYSRD